MNVAIKGLGTYLPERILTNHDLEAMVETSDEWITTRTGIKERHIAAEGETASDMAAKAANIALENAGITAEDVDLIVLGTITPDQQLPATACFVQEKIGAKNAFAFDVQAACTGFIYATSIAEQYIKAGTVKTALVVNTEKLSAVTNWEDRETCVLFGDGASAVVLQEATGDEKGIMSSILKSDGKYTDLLRIETGGSNEPVTAENVGENRHKMMMSGREVFKLAVGSMVSVGKEALEAAGVDVNEIKYVIPHQANMRIISSISSKLKLDLDEHFYNNLPRVGNTSSASILLALAEAIEAGKIEKGDKLLFVAFGGGLTWGAMVVEI
jgi:3-oxoacyl-[acyl-carrier-protein] synthase-3